MMFQPPKFYHGWKGVNYVRHFEQHLGRALTTDEHVVIESLEHRRLKGRGIRAVIYDPSPSLLSSTVEAYFRWVVNFICSIVDRYSAHRLQALFAAKAARSKACARAFPRARTRSWTWRACSNARGFWFDHILVLDWQTRFKSIPRIKEAWDQVNRALLPCLPDGARYSTFIIHTHCPLPFYKTVPTFLYVETPSAHAACKRPSACFRGFYPFLPQEPELREAGDSSPALLTGIAPVLSAFAS